ncbi:DUF948 domain-containing protein [Bacillaceae bacterium W0354]
MNLLHISALIAAIAFFILVIFLVRTLMSFSKTLNSVTKTLDNVATTVQGFERQMEGVTKETTLLLNKSNQLAGDLINNTGKLDVLFDGIKGIGHTVQEFNLSLQKLSDELKEQADEHAEKTSQTIKWGEAAIHLWKKYKGR